MERMPEETKGFVILFNNVPEVHYLIEFDMAVQQILLAKLEELRNLCRNAKMK